METTSLAMVANHEDKIGGINIRINVNAFYVNVFAFYFKKY